jgi:hypothetical protein
MTDMTTTRDRETARDPAGPPDVVRGGARAAAGGRGRTRVKIRRERKLVTPIDRIGTGHSAATKA